MFSIFDNLVAHYFDSSLGNTKPIQSETEQNPVILTCKILPGVFLSEFRLPTVVLSPIEQRNPGQFRSTDVCGTDLTILVQLDELRLHENVHRSYKQSVSHVRISRTFEHAALRRLNSVGNAHDCRKAFARQTQSLHQACRDQDNLFFPQSIAMSTIRQLTLLSQLL